MKRFDGGMTIGLIPIKQRKRFNSLRGLLDSGAFITGSAIAGLLFTIGTPNMAIYLNATALCLSAFPSLCWGYPRLWSLYPRL